MDHGGALPIFLPRPPPPRRASLVLAFAILTTGCVQTRPLDVGSDSGRAEVNARAIHSAATLRVAAGPTRLVRGLHVGPVETTWTDRLSGEPHSTPTADVASVSFRRPGARRAALVGAGLGTALGLLASTEDQSGLIQFSPALYVFGGAAWGTLIGGAVGVSRQDRYVVEELGPAAGGPRAAAVVPDRPSIGASAHVPLGRAR